MPQTDKPQSDSPTVEPTVEPIPPRYWWLKRIGVGVGLLVIAVVALRLWWGWEANRRLQAEIDRIIAAGEPIYPEDFDPKEETPDDQNAAVLLRAAAQALSLTPDQGRLIDAVLADRRSADKHLEELRELGEMSAEIVALIHRSRDLARVDWKIPLGNPAIWTLLPDLPSQRTMGRLIGALALYRHASGDDRAAVDLLYDLHALQTRTGSYPALASYLASLRMASNTALTIEAIGPTLRVEPPPAADSTHIRRASRLEIQGLIAFMLDDKQLIASFHRGLLFERMVQLDAVRFVRKNGYASLIGMLGTGRGVGLTSATNPFEPLISPLYQLDAVVMLRTTSAYAQAALSDDWPSAKRAMPAFPSFSGAFDRTMHPLSSMVLARLEHSYRMQFRSMALRRMGAVALAIRVYEVDYGHRPRDLRELVPNYLPNLPADPFSADREPIRYRLDTPLPILYCIGFDGVDDGGAYSFRAGEIDPDKLDVPFFLDGNRPTKPEDVSAAPPPSTQAGEDQKNIEEDRRDAHEAGEEKP